MSGVLAMTDATLVGVVVGIYYGIDGWKAEVSRFHNGARHDEWYPPWRLTIRDT